MSTINPVTDVTAVTDALTTAITDVRAVISFNTDTSASPTTNKGNAGYVNMCEGLLKSLLRCQQELNDPRYRLGSRLDTSLDVS
jgi:hypothetical protein